MRFLNIREKNEFLIKLLFLSALIIPLLYISSVPAYGYFDPATINLYLQIIAGGLVGIVLGFKFFWNSIKRFFAIVPYHNQ